MNNIGELLKKIRFDLDMTQPQMAGLLNVKQSHISQIESNDTDPSIRFLRTVEEYCGVNFRISYEKGNHRNEMDGKASETDERVQRFNPEHPWTWDAG